VELDVEIRYCWAVDRRDDGGYKTRCCWIVDRDWRRKKNRCRCGNVELRTTDADVVVNVGIPIRSERRVFMRLMCDLICFNCFIYFIYC
jgi:hypothetical protein